MSISMVPQQVSFVERSSLSQRVPYRRSHCFFFSSSQSSRSCPVNNVRVNQKGNQAKKQLHFTQDNSTLPVMYVSLVP